MQRGVKEIVLIAQDTGRWGQDFEEPSNLAHLVGTLANTFPQTWFRLMYIQPEGITDELLQVVCAHNNVCNYFDIPIQHVNADILKAMNRSGSQQEYETLVKNISARIPDVTLRTTLIAGFPGETDEAFQELCQFVEKSEFDYIGVFPYSQEEGTRAATMPDQVSQDEKRERAQELRDIADAVCAARISQRIGKKMDVLVLGTEEDGQQYGRARCQAPDVDGVTYTNKGKPGEIVTVEIIDTLYYEMEGE